MRNREDFRSAILCMLIRLPTRGTPGVHKTLACPRYRQRHLKTTLLNFCGPTTNDTILHISTVLTQMDQELQAGDCVEYALSFML